LDEDAFRKVKTMVKMKTINSWMAHGENLEEAVCNGIIVTHEGKDVTLAPEHPYLRIKGSKEELCRTHYEMLQRYVTQGVKVIYERNKQKPQ